MSKEKVKPRVRRCSATGDWLAIVLIGERHHCFGTYNEKRHARKAARRHAREMEAQQH